MLENNLVKVEYFEESVSINRNDSVVLKQFKAISKIYFLHIYTKYIHI